MKLNINLRLLTTIFGLVLALNACFQSFYLPYTTLNKGLGYDGMHYIYKAVNWSASTESYHAFRLLPSLLVNLGLKLSGVEMGNIDYGIRGFQILNILLTLFTFLLAYKIQLVNKWKLRETFIWYILLFFNFWTLKHAFYMPVMTDCMVFFLAMLSLYAWLMNRIYLQFIVGLLGMFTNPLISLICICLVLTNKNKDTFNEDKNLPIQLIAAALSFGITFLSYWVVSLKHNFFIYSYQVNIGWLWVSYLGLFLTSFFLLFHWLSATSIYSFKRLYSTIDWRYIWVPFTYFMIYYIINLSFKVNTSELNNDNIFVNFGAILRVIKPFSGLIEHLCFYGFTGLLIFWYWKRIADVYFRFQSGFIGVLFLCLTLLLAPDGRLLLSFIPFLVFGLFLSNSLSKLKGYQIGIIFVFNLFFSKVWYPMHWAKFASHYLDNERIFLNYPAQHFYQFISFTASNFMYSIWSLFVIGMVILGYFFVLKPMKKHAVS